MNTLFLDIETIPAPEEKHEALKFLFEKRLEKKAARRKEISEEVIVEEERREPRFEDYVRGTSFDGSFGQVLCVGVAVNDDPSRCYYNPGNEKKTLEQFWSLAKQCDLFVGHNAMDFDLKFLWQRSIILGIKPSWQDDDPRAPKYLSFARYRSFPVFDTMHEWQKWGRDNVGLEHLALALGIPTPKDGIDGSKVYDFYKAGKIDEICEYCKRDVETTRAIYKRMVFR